MSTVMIDHIQMPIPEAIRYCLMGRNAALIRAHQAKHDLAWFKAHNPAEYDMQMQKNPVCFEVCIAREYHRHALNLRRLDRTTPKQATLL